MFSIAKKLFKRASGKNENTQTQTDKNDNSDLQDASTFTSVKVIQLQHKSNKLVSSLQRVVYHQLKLTSRGNRDDTNETESPG